MRMKKLQPLKLSLALNILFLIVIGLLLFQMKDEIYNVTHQKGKYDVVMFGNSLTAGCKWNRKLTRLNVKNSGTNGYTTTHLLWSLDKKVLNHNPRFCIIMGGTNDISTGIPLSVTQGNFKKIVTILLENNVQPVLQSTLYVNHPKDSIKNSRINELNQFLSALANSNKLTFLDLNAKLSHNKKLKKEFTSDGTHLNKAAYDIWINEIDTFLSAN